MNKFSNGPAFSALGGLALTLPFIILEWANTPGFLSSGIPPLFLIMWLSGSIFIFILASLLRKGKKAKIDELYIARVVFMVLSAWIFIGLVLDQWPCFMGIPNCD